MLLVTTLYKIKEDRSVLECASTVRAGLSTYLEDLLESIQRKALRIIFGNLEYASAMPMAGLDSLTDRRAAACEKFSKQHTSVPYKRYPLPNIPRLSISSLFQDTET